MTQAFHPPRSRAEANPRRWVALFVLLAANFMNLIDVSIVNVALPSLSTHLHAAPSAIEWVVAGYVVPFALGLLPFGRLGDIVGRTRLFLIGVGLFTLASAFCGLAPSIEWLIAARVLQGLAAAVMAPQVMAIVQVTFPPEEKGTAFALFGLANSLAAVAGPLVAGVLIEANLFGLDWRPIFLVNLPVGILALIAGIVLVPRTPGHPELKNDYAGIALFGIAALAIVFPMIEGRNYGWPLWAFGLMALSVVFAVLFCLWVRRREQQGQPQLLNWALLSNRSFLHGLVLTTLFGSGVPALFFVISLTLQSGFGFRPLESGLANVPFSLGVLVVSVLLGKFGQRYLKQRMMIGAGLLLVGIAWLDITIQGFGETASVLAMTPPLVVAGIGLGMGFSSLFQLVLMGVPPRDAGSGSGALQAFQQLGGAIGVAVVGEVYFPLIAQKLAAGVTPAAAYGAAAGPAMLCQIVSFGLVLVLAAFFRPGKVPAVGRAQGAAPVAEH